MASEATAGSRALKDWEPVIGLEVHAQLLTRSKIFCSCPTAFGAPPNTQVCPVCLGLPGVPLVEIVGEPELRSAEEASEYLKSLRLALIYLGINDGNLEEGSFRCDANVSVRRRGTSKFGTRVELKNINSFRFVRQAIEHEIARQVEAIEKGEKIRQETRLFDHAAGVTRPMRSKEEANDYRYFPEPDLPPLTVPQALVEGVEVPPLPHQVLEQLQAEGVSAADARTLIDNIELLRIYKDATLAGARTAQA